MGNYRKHIERAIFIFIISILAVSPVFGKANGKTTKKKPATQTSQVPTAATDKKKSQKQPVVANSFTPVVVAQNPEPASAPATPEPTATAPVVSNPSAEATQNPNVLPLQLREVVESTLRNNVGIVVQEYNAKIQMEKITDSESVFDPKLSAQISADETKSQVSSALANPNISRNDNKTWNVKVSQKVETGANYELSFNNNRLKTNSLFAGLNPQYTSQLGLTLTQPLLKNSGIDINKTDIYIANNNKNISEFEFKDKVIKTLVDVENLYWDLVFTIEDLRVKEKSLKRAHDLERRVQAQVQVGTLAPLEILQAKAEVASRQQKLVAAEDEIRDNEDKLKNTMNLGFATPDDQKTILPMDRPDVAPPNELILDDAIKVAFEKRQDYLARKKDLENKNIRVRFNENQLYPTVDLIGSLGLNGIAGEAKSITSVSTGATTQSTFGGNYGDSLGFLSGTDYYNWSVGVQLAYPIGNRSAKSKLTASRLEAQQALMDLKDLEKKIIVEVRDAVRQVKTDFERVKAAGVARKLTEEKLSAEEKKFEVGLSTSFNVLQFQEDLATEQSNEIKALIDYNKTQVNLHKAIADHLEYRNIKLAGDSTP